MSGEATGSGRIASGQRLWRRFRRFCAGMRDEQRVPAERFERD